MIQNELSKYSSSMTDTTYVMQLKDKLIEFIAESPFDIRLVKFYRNKDKTHSFVLKTSVFVFNCQAYELFSELFSRCVFSFDVGKIDDKDLFVTVTLNNKPIKKELNRQFGYTNTNCLMQFPEYISYMCIRAKGITLSHYFCSELKESIYDVGVNYYIFPEIADQIYRLMKVCDSFTISKNTPMHFNIQFCVTAEKMKNAYKYLDDDVIYWKDV